MEKEGFEFWEVETPYLYRLVIHSYISHISSMLAVQEILTDQLKKLISTLITVLRGFDCYTEHLYLNLFSVYLCKSKTSNHLNISWSLPENIICTGNFPWMMNLLENNSVIFTSIYNYALGYPFLILFMFGLGWVGIHVIFSFFLSMLSEICFCFC